MKSELFWKILKHMSKLNQYLNVSVNLSKLPKEYLEKSANGDIYLPLKLLVFTEPNEYGKDVAVVLRKPKGDESETIWLGGGWSNYVEKRDDEEIGNPPLTRQPQVINEDDLPF